MPESVKKFADEMLERKPTRLLKQLISELDYLDKEDVDLVKKAYAYASVAHEHQSRKSGEPYIVHPTGVASILADLRLDKASIAAGLLHDVLEDTVVNEALLSKEFGLEVLSLVDGVSKLDQIEHSDIKHHQAESFRKMMLAMVKDIRVILIKLADRLHNIQTLHALEQGKQIKIAKETLEVYAPIANRLGIYNIKTALEEGAFKYGYPFRHKVLRSSLKRKLGNQKRILKKISKRISKKLDDDNIDHKITAREKDLYSIYTKMKRRRLSLDKIIDVYGFRIIVDSSQECYRVLGLVHEIYKPIIGKFKDYIAIPRVNGYQSIHTSLLGPNGTAIEIQIRTEDMDQVAESGIAAHWKYKSTTGDDSTPQIKAREWLANIKEIQGTAHPEEFLERIKLDLYPDKIYVFSPDGDIYRLPNNSTCVDFAYAIHTDIGNSCIGAKIDRSQVPLRTVLESGQTVQIMTSRYSSPDPSWLSFITTAKARHNLRSYLKDLNVEQTIVLGKRLFDNALNALGKKQRNIKKEQISGLLERMDFKDMEQFYESMGVGDKNPLLMAQILLGEEHLETRSNDHKPLLIKGTEGVSINFAKCCLPIPGDSIIGHLSKVKGLVIHRRKCHHLGTFIKESSRWIGAEWSDDIEHGLSTEITVHAKHKPGSLAAIAGKLADNGCNVEQVSLATEYEDETIDILFQIQVSSRKDLADIMRGIKAMGNVERVSRSLH